MWKGTAFSRSVVVPSIERQHFALHVDCTSHAVELCGQCGPNYATNQDFISPFQRK